jgi:aldehyde:ferredoxin oxidoreductase
MLDEYYSVRGWSRDGVPTKSKLASLGLHEVVQDLELRGLRLACCPGDL